MKYQHFLKLVIFYLIYKNSILIGNLYLTDLVTKNCTEISIREYIDVQYTSSLQVVSILVSQG